MGELIKKRVQVVFNIADPDQKELYQRVIERKNQSAYMKRLIQRDIDQAFHANAPSTLSNSSSRAIQTSDDMEFSVGDFV
ncbi:hypothetical protein [Bacillus sp. FJAT-28004]|uniref:hypothetical protein n=1 Tax=Bacillus sp. FJAT-28004 TaxID=1679165 RepID=UPI0006B3F9F4|nr:hypothetical protein [Bacillus sp. FJAT-28004]